MIRYETLKKYCKGYDAIQPELTYAVRIDGCWWATDSMQVICVPMEHCQEGDMRFLVDELPEKMKYPKIEDVLKREDFKARGTVSKAELEEALEGLPKVMEMRDVETELEYVECDCCDGSGRIDIEDSVYWEEHYFEVGAEVECPVCHGYGKIPDIEDYDPEEDDYDPEIDTTYMAKEETGRMIPDMGAVAHLKDIGAFKGGWIENLLAVMKEMGVETVEHGKGKGAIVEFNVGGVFVAMIDKEYY